VAQTRRITYNGGSPSTEYGEGADLVAQSEAGNYSVIRVSATAINRGDTSSFSNNQGAHTAAIDGAGQTQRTGTISGGVGGGAVRWDQSVDLSIGHDSRGFQGGVTLRQTISGWHNNVQTAALSGFPRIPKRPPSSPTVPTFDQVLPTSVRVSWTWPGGDDGGRPIDAYLLRYWPNAAGTGAYIDHSYAANSGPRVVAGLTPGQQYRFVVYAHNAAQDNNGFSDPSPAAVIRTLSGMWIKIAGVWKRTVPYVKVAGKWRTVSVFIKDKGVWKRGG